MDEMNRNQMAVAHLKFLDYSLPNIRKALHKLTGISQPKVAEIIGTSRINVTHHMSGIRSHRDIQEKIAEIFEIPIDVLFEDNINQD